MSLSSIFNEPINRPIEGVIKADDEASLLLEVKEYVLTNEVAKRLESFLDAYNNYEGANGVWISGFFGSGKSHLLKILALLLENRSIEGTPILEMFLPKCKDNEILKGDLKRAVAIPTKSILFNIDQKADVISKTQIDALLSVFVKVFDEMCGYYGKQGHIARFERDLDSRGLYEKFKDHFQKCSGLDWKVGREQALLESQNIAEAYAQANGGTKQEALGILDKYRSDYKVSIEDFAQQVHDYIEKQDSNFRLNFFVDEVGQYIADNIKLMTNLQTIAESLATKSRGKAWIIVTAQEDMNAVVGEMGKQQGNDFSKIQARFANRMKLTSTDVAEVIQKRLLMKNEKGVEKLNDIYHTQSNNFKTLFDFADGSQSYRNFNDRDHFIHCYPFIPYQFALFQSAIQNLSLHNAFEGKHSSVGERSMLGVFQQVAIHISDHELGQLATFDLMFEGIRSALKSQIQHGVLMAEKHLDNLYAIRVLKALFLVKYVKEFKPTVRNLCVLMLDEFNQNLPALIKKLEEALNLLEQQTYIQRNGDQYEFLTDEEKDIEEEIKNMEVDPSEVAEDLSKIIFESVIKQRKIRYEENGQDYPFTKKLDDRMMGRESELTIHVITPFHDQFGNEELLKMQSMGRDELLVIFPPDDRLMRDGYMYKKTEKFIKQNVTIAQKEEIKRILTDKSFQNRERYSDLQQRVQTLLGKAKIIASGDEIEVGGENAQVKITQGFYELIARTYPNLRMLRGITYSEKDVRVCLQPASDTLFGNDNAALAESEQELLAFIQANNRSGIRTTLKSLVENFEKKPYGWYLAAILCTLAKLCARGKVEVRSDSNPLEDKELEKALLNTHAHANLILEPQIDFTASQVRQLKEFYSDFFDGPPSVSEARAIGKETATKFQELNHTLEKLKAQVSQYPFLEALNQPIEQVRELSGKPYTFYLTELSSKIDPLLDCKENVLDPIRRLMNGPQKGLYDEARKFIQDAEPNFSSIEGEEATQIKEALSDPECYKGNRIQQTKVLVDSLKSKVEEQLKRVKSETIDAVNSLKDRLENMEDFKSMTADQQKNLIQPFHGFIQQVERQTLIAVIRDTLRRFEEQEYSRVLSQLSALKAPVKDYKEGKQWIEEKTKVTPVKEPVIEYVSARNIKPHFEKAWLANESDVDQYLEGLRKKMLEEIENGKRIQI